MWFLCALRCTCFYLTFPIWPEELDKEIRGSFCSSFLVTSWCDNQNLVCIPPLSFVQPQIIITCCTSQQEISYLKFSKSLSRRKQEGGNLRKRDVVLGQYVVWTWQNFTEAQTLVYLIVKCEHPIPNLFLFVLLFHFFPL